MTARTIEIKGSLAFEVTYVSTTEATGSMPIQAGMLNPLGRVTAGAMIWFADIVATALVLQGQEPSQDMSSFPLAITLNANVVSNTTQGTLRAGAVFVKKGRRLSTVRTVVESDEGRVLLDLATTHFMA